jgi:hypothetical protein
MDDMEQCSTVESLYAVSLGDGGSSLRIAALQLALQRGHDRQNDYAVIDTAKVFEAYLRGDNA